MPELAEITPQSGSLLGFLTPTHILNGLWRNRYLLQQLIRRDLMQRYRGSALGLVWSLALPLTMLAVYTFVFSIVFKAKWGTLPGDSRAEFALTLFCGMVVYGIFGEVQGRAPATIVSGMNYVKKVVFPLELLPAMTIGTALFQGAIGLAVIIAGELVLVGKVPITILYLPVVLLPLICASAGFSWFLASLGVFIRDMDHIVAVLVQVLFFATPILYPSEMVPEQFRWILTLNPLSAIIDDARRVVLWDMPPDWARWASITVVAFVVMQLGYAWFMKTKRGFADVL